MATLFTQSILQFAPLREFARIDHTCAQYSQLIRELFPKALFKERKASNKLFFEIAWSFLSGPETIAGFAAWSVRNYPCLIIGYDYHRIGGLPAVIHRGGSRSWWEDGKYHRSDKDRQTKLTFPAVIYAHGSYYWYKRGCAHRVDKDPRTNLTLPAAISNGEKIQAEWYLHGVAHRVDKDPQTGLILPAIIHTNERQWCIEGCLMKKQ